MNGAPARTPFRLSLYRRACFANFVRRMPQPLHTAVLTESVKSISMFEPFPPRHACH